MFCARTPAKKVTNVSPKTSPTGTDAKSSPPKTIQYTNVRRSIGEIEGKMEKYQQPGTSNVHQASPVKTGPTAVPGAPTKLKQKAAGAPSEVKSQMRRVSVDAAEGSPGPKPDSGKTADRVMQARNWLQKAKTHIGDSRNLRADLKAGIILAVENLYRLVKEGSMTAPETKNTVSEELHTEVGITKQEGRDLIKMLKEQGEKIDITFREVERLKETVSSHQTVNPIARTYAEMAAVPLNNNQERVALHSVVITSKNELDTGEEVLEKVRKAVNAKDGWVTVERVRKVKDRKVVVGCRTEEERERIKERLKGAQDRLTVENVTNQDPMVIVKDVLSSHSDEDIIKALRNQNKGIFKDLDAKDDRVEVKFRRIARNSHNNHVALKVSPLLYNRMLNRGYMHIDLQKVIVKDQSPLVQCSICLGYGHGRRFCRETIPKCSHCGDPHLRETCPDWLARAAPTCCNCTAAKLENVGHNAFSAECQVRRRWEALARAKVAYC